MLDAEQQFLHAIQAEPDADAPRLVYADWLGERGDPRGELITVQCALERRDLAPEQRAALARRSAELAPRVPERAFQLALPVHTSVADNVAAWSRGFVPARTIWCRTEDFFDRKDELFRLAPCARELRLSASGVHAPWREVLADPDVARWRGLCGIRMWLVPALPEHAHLAALRRLAFEADEDEDPEVLEPLLASECLPALTALAIHGPAIDGYAPGLRTLPVEHWRRAAFATELREFTGEMVDSLAAFPKLERYSGYFYGNDAARELVAGSRLRTLRLGPFGDDEPLDLATLDALCTPALETLALSLDRVTRHTSAGWRALDRSPLHTLALRGRWLDDGLLLALAGGPRLSGLRALRLDGPASDAALDALIAVLDAPQLEELDLGLEPRAADRVARFVARCPRLRRLRCGVAEDIPAVLARGELARLEVLELRARYTGRFVAAPPPALRLLQLLDRPAAHERDTRADGWARTQGFQVLPSYDRDIRTFARLGPGFWTWAASFLLNRTS